MAVDGKVAYEWSKVLNFTTRGNALPYCVSGWGEPETGLVWTDGPNARLSFSIRPPKSDISLLMTCAPFLVEGKVPFQELHVFVNFLRVGFAVLPAPTEVAVDIPKHVFASPQVQIDFYLPRASSPASLGVGTDLRQLGVAVSRLMLTEE